MIDLWTDLKYFAPPYLHHNTAQHLQIGNHQLGLRVQLMPDAVQLRLQYLVELLGDAVLDGNLGQINEPVHPPQLLDQQIHYVQHVRLDLRHT